MNKIQLRVHVTTEIEARNKVRIRRQGKDSACSRSEIYKRSRRLLATVKGVHAAELGGGLTGGGRQRRLTGGGVEIGGREKKI